MPADRILRRIEIVTRGDPRSKTRARRSKHGQFYTDPLTRNHEEMLGWAFRAEVGHEMFLGNVEVDAHFYRSNYQRIDVDNMLKLVLDAATGVVWADDHFVTKITAEVHYDKENPRTTVVCTEHESTMRRGQNRVGLVAKCKTCGKDFVYHEYTSTKGKAPVYCSRECMKRQPMTCPECCVSFRSESHIQRFCSKKCAAQSKATKAKIASARRRNARPPNLCRKCGTPLARRGAVLCRPCWLSAPKAKRKDDFRDA